MADGTNALSSRVRAEKTRDDFMELSSGKPAFFCEVLAIVKP
jgi:hypothetical protein